jgi:hypothetical protein
MVNIPQAGLVAPAAGFVVDGRVAPPLSVTELVELYVNPAGSASDSETAVAVPVLDALAAVIV